MGEKLLRPEDNSARPQEEERRKARDVVMSQVVGMTGGWDAETGDHSLLLSWKVQSLRIPTLGRSS